MFTFRLFFYVFALMELYAERDTIDPFWLTVIWVTATMVVPICFWIPLVFKKSMYFCFAELLLNGSLTIYAMQFSNTYTSLFIISALTISFHLEKRHYWLIVILTLYPFSQFMIKGILLKNLVLFLYF